MSRAKGRRPVRGGGGGGLLGDGVLVSGDEGQYEPQGGAGGGVESGDLQSREFGVPQADIPGGVRHVVNPQTKTTKPGGVHERPADEHKFHGVPPIDLGDYDQPEDEAGIALADVPKAAPEPKLDEAVPVYIIEQPGNQGRKLRHAIPFNISVRAAGQEPSRICNQDPDRVEVLLLNEDASTDIRISNRYSELQVADAAGTGPAGAGALVWHGTNSYTKIRTQGELFAITTSISASARMSVILVTESPSVVGG